MTSDLALKALTNWWGEMGVAADEAVLKAFREAARQPASQPANAGRPVAAGQSQRQQEESARALAAGCMSLEALAEAIAAFEGCPLKAGTMNTVVFDGVPSAPVLVIGEGPGAEEDKTGKPFVGPAGQLLDRMLAAIGLSRTENALITNVCYWRPPGNRNPTPEELAVCRPFVDRFVELAAPKLIIAAGAVASQSLLATTTGIMKLRGTAHAFTTPGGTQAPLCPILHPAFLLRRPQEKSRAWRDLLGIEERMREAGIVLSPA